MKLFSKFFKDGGYLPRKFTCEGKDILPPLYWTDVPEGTRGFVLLMVDIDTPKPFLHLFLYNLPPTLRSLRNDAIPDKVAYLVNEFGNLSYNGPCPPRGKRHTYRFMLVAVDAILKEMPIEKMMANVEKHTLDQALLTCTYKKSIEKTANTSIPLEQQKAILRYAPKDKLWRILDEDDAWYDALLALPEPYRQDFAALINKLGTDKERILAKTYIRQKVTLPHLQNVIVSAWNPANLEEASAWLRKNGFLRRPLMPLNLRASIK